jgi:tetratricopeptide (TPR) repeat protein
VLGSLLQLHAEDEAALQARGFCLRKVGSYAAAAADYGRLISLGQASVRNFNSRAYCCASLGKYSEAVADYTEAIKVGRLPGWGH